MSAETSGPVMNIATDNVVTPTQDAIPVPKATIPVSVNGLDHFGLDLPDLEAAEKWYVEVLGAEVLERRGWGGGIQPSKPHTDIRIGDPGSVISMFIGEPTTLNTGSSVHWCFRVEDSSIEALEAWNGHLLSKDVRNEIWGHFGVGVISTYFRDPWEYRYEFSTYYPDWPAAEKVLQEGGYPFIGEGGKFPTV